MKYSIELTQKLLDLYQSGTPTSLIAETLNRSERSIIAKLAELRVYETAAPKAKRETKTEICQQIELKIGESLENLNKLTIRELKLLRDRL